MTTRRSARPTQVRPRPPSSGRPVPVKARPTAPQPGRIASHRPIRRTQSLPLVMKVALALGVVVLGIGVLYVGLGGLRFVAGGLSASFAGFVDKVTATPSPEPTVIPLAKAPTMAAPREPYTNAKQVDLVVTVPSELVGSVDHRIRLYLALKDQPPTAIQEVQIGATPQTVITVALEKGINDFTATIVGPSGESGSSPVAQYVLDTSKPKITVTSPKKNAEVNRKSVELKGKVQARSTLIARNLDNGASITGTADNDGTFTLPLALQVGTNNIRIDATDPAGNANSIDYVVRRGTGKLTARLSASDYFFSRGSLPTSVKLTASVDDPDGAPLKGATVTFTLSIPGIPTVTKDVITNANGRAVFETTIPAGADKGQGSAAILVETDDFGTTQDFTNITITK